MNTTAFNKVTGLDAAAVTVEMLLPGSWHGKVRYMLIGDLIVADGVSEAGYTVPDGFVTDGASVPPFLWSVFPPVGRYFVAACVHDHALQRGMPWPDANDLFKRVLHATGVIGWRRHAMVLAVRSYGLYKRIKRRFNDEG